MSTIKPPFTDSITRPFTDLLLSAMSCMSPHAFSNNALFTDNNNLPSSSSLSKTSALTFSPTLRISFGLTDFFTVNSLEGITPSDLYPTSKNTSLLSILTTVPSITSPAVSYTHLTLPTTP